MKKISIGIFVFIFSIFFNVQVWAQLLDDEDNQDTASSVMNSDDDALFEEMFNDFSENEKDITKVKTFDDAISVLSEKLEKSDTTAEEELEPAQIQPLQGEMFIGIRKGSFRIFRDMSGRTRCSFEVVLKSDLEKGIKTMALNLVYPNWIFAFVFRDLPPQEKQIRHITTTGDICYTMTGAPDITIHTCKIRETLASDCINHIKWSEDLE